MQGIRKPKMSDPDFSFATEKEARKDQRIREDIADYRRSQIKSIDPNRKTPKDWKVRDEKPVGPGWEFERDEEGKVSLARQLRTTPNSMDLDARYLGKRFVCEITGASCLVGGEHVEKGCRLDCFADAALAIHRTTGWIIEEYNSK